MHVAPSSMKTCSKCGDVKSEEEFSWRARHVRRASACKTCHSVYHRSWMLRHGELRRRQIAARVKELAVWFRGLKTGKSCMDCGMSYPYWVLDFDHVGPKTLTPARIAKRGWSKARALKELSQCELVCANCHRERTHRRRLEAKLRRRQGSQPGFEPGQVLVQVEPPQPT